MLLNIDQLLTGEILHTLDDLGHNDRLLVADANFPWRKYNVPTHRIGTSTVPAMQAILHVFPLEQADGDAVVVRTHADGDSLNELQLEILEIGRQTHGAQLEFSTPTRAVYRELLKSTSAIVLLTDLLPSNFFLRKGMITP